MAGIRAVALVPRADAGYYAEAPMFGGRASDLPAGQRTFRVLTAELQRSGFEIYLGHLYPEVTQRLADGGSDAEVRLRVQSNRTGWVGSWTVTVRRFDLRVEHDAWTAALRLPSLLALARRPHAPLHLVLAVRPYARDGIHTTLARAGFDVSEILDLPQLRELTWEETQALAREALSPEYLDLAGLLATHSGNSPLVTVLGAQLIRREQLDPRLLSQRDEFRRIVLNAFRDELLGKVGEHADAGICRDVLRLAAAIGPFRSDMPEVRDAARAFLEIRADEWQDALDALVGGGVLLRRGRMLRITPDVLANYVLEDACLDSGGRSTGYVERVHAAFRDAAPGALLRNLAELDWRRERGGGGASGGERLMGGIWDDMEREFHTAGVARQTEMIRGLGVVAYYQPGHALRLVRMAGPSPAFWASPGEVQALTRVVPPVLGTIAYNLEYTGDCCELLWRLARDQPIDADPQSPLAVLHGLAGYRLHKPIELQHTVVTAVERWVAEPDAHQHLLSPLDVLTPVLAKTALSPGWEPLLVLPEFTADLRERALAIVSAAARQEDVRAARRAREMGWLRELCIQFAVNHLRWDDRAAWPKCLTGDELTR